MVYLFTKYPQLASLVCLSLNCLVSGNLVCYFNGHCKDHGNKVKDCMCNCLEVKYTNQRYLHLYTNYRCGDILKACNATWNVSFSYTVSTTVKGIFTSDYIDVPYNKEIVTEIKGLDTEGTYIIKIKPSCTFCGKDCLKLPYINVVIPKETDYTSSKETENKMPAAATSSSDYITLSVVVALACFLSIWIVLFNTFTISHNHYLQPPEYG